jgi:diguanylate cyclase (GGDEF)-like protein/PAS domain S-box-containing protein
MSVLLSAVSLAVSASRYRHKQIKEIPMQAATHLSFPHNDVQASKPTPAPCHQRALSMFGVPLQLSARSIALAFSLFGSCWVLVTNLLLEQKLMETVNHARLHFTFGLLFVLLTAVLLYQLVRRYATELSCSSELIARVFEASPGGIVVVREQGSEILLINRQFETLTGYSPADVAGRSTSDLNLWGNKEERLTLINRLRNEELVQGFDASFRHRDGSLFPGVVTARRFNFNGQPCTIAFIEDTSRQELIARQVEELTRYDVMTGLPNQKLLTERLNHLLPISSREGQGLAVLSLALGRCPSTISAMGHDGCDELLRCVAMRLRGSLRETDVLAVLQKGEFSILLPKTESERDLLPVITKLLGCISEPISIAEAEFQLHAHIGVAIFPGDGRTGEVLLQHSHLAMTQAQANAGENYFQFYAEEMNRIANEQLQVESSILKGIRTGEFFVCYQPIFDREGKRMVSMEALARWQHPMLGLVGPDKFIPVAEANGTIIPLGELVLELALRNCQHWRENGYPHLTVAVNVSARQMKDRQFADRVAQLLLLSGLPPEALCCELTESMLMEHSNENTEQIFRLKDLGVKLAIDDFGTGYSSLTHLKHLPVDTIKVDRSFVTDIVSNTDDRAIVSAIVAMARSLHLKVVAEGVETEQQHRLLQELGCDTMQGYYFGKPMDRSRFETFLYEQPPTISAVTAVAPARGGKPVRQNGQQKQTQEDRPLQSVTDITLKIHPLKPCDRLTTALERFQTDKLQQVLPVVDQHRVVGILNRSEFIEEQVVGRIGYAFHINHSKKVRDLMQPVPLVIDSEASIEEAAQALHGNFGTMRLENICVARRGIYQGVLDVRTLVEAITALNLKLAKGANPLTGLPGNESIQRETTRWLDSGMPFDIAYIDIDNFKPYNDFYGFERGDMVIGAVGDILKLYASDLLQGPQVRNFCGHIGGDDFIIITGPGNAAGLSRQVIAEFDARLPLLHGSSDYAKGCYTSFNRKGDLETFHLLSLSVAVISTGQLRVSSYPQLASMASDVKKTAKKVKGSSVVVKAHDETISVVFGDQIEEQ